ncbi:MAG: type II toxin-antitoxin system VapC family toxin [Opitutae bacterium]|nr:type II toxin-antitoxin system VapC family toxin [Opitutae bacterium]
MAASEVFADTSALYALVDRRDFGHAAAKEAVGRLVRAGRMIVTTDYVVTETVNLANARGGALVAGRVLDLIEQSAGIRVEWIGVERFGSAKVFFRKHSDHGYSFTDCTSFVVMREERITEALTTDGHFAEAGFRALLSPS